MSVHKCPQRKEQRRRVKEDTAETRGKSRWASAVRCGKRAGAMYLRRLCARRLGKKERSKKEGNRKRKEEKEETEKDGTSFFKNKNSKKALGGACLPFCLSYFIDSFLNRQFWCGEKAQPRGCMGSYTCDARPIAALCRLVRLLSSCVSVLSSKFIVGRRRGYMPVLGRYL